MQLTIISFDYFAKDKKNVWHVLERVEIIFFW